MFGLLKKSAMERGRIGIVVRQDEVAIAVVQRQDESRPVLARCEVLPLAGPASSQSVADLLRAAGLPASPVSTVLAYGQYQLLPTDAPDVPPAELRAAMRWRLREAIEFPVEEAVIDVFDSPSGSRSQGRMLYAVAARRSVIEQQSALLAWNPRFDVIEVPELVLRNLASRASASGNGVAFLHLDGSTATVVLVRGSTFYFSRQMVLQTALQLGVAGEGEPAIDAASVALELQRSLDYYERHFDQPPINQVWIGPAGPQAHSLVESLAAETGLAVGEFDLNAQLQCVAPVEARIQKACLLAVGAALRVERRTL